MYAMYAMYAMYIYAVCVNPAIVSFRTCIYIWKEERREREREKIR